MNYWMFAAGLAVVAFVFLDALWTTLWSEGGAGPMTARLGAVYWAGFRRLTARKGRINHQALSLAGPVSMVFGLVTWLVVMWSGMVMMLSAHPDAVVAAQSKVPADVTDRIWFVLYTTTTVGNGDYSPNTDFFQVLVGLIGASGIALLTLVLTYTSQVLTAVVDRRAFASHVTSVGSTPAAIVSTLRASGPTGVAAHFSSLSEQLGLLTEQHKAYPIIHYFHSVDRTRSSPCAVAILDEALRIYRAGLHEDELVVDSAVVDPLVNTIGTHLEELQESYLERADHSPANPDLDDLARRGVELSDPDQVSRANEDDRERRRLLAGMVDYDGWDWTDLISHRGMWPQPT